MAPRLSGSSRNGAWPRSFTVIASSPSTSSAMRARVAALRGEHSDLLSPATLARMAGLVEGLDAVTVKDRGHAPFLDEPESLGAIDRLLARCP